MRHDIIRRIVHSLLGKLYICLPAPRDSDDVLFFHDVGCAGFRRV
jgi:hypothetical protein